jgi:hypothetical protein
MRLMRQRKGAAPGDRQAGRQELFLKRVTR